MSVQVKIASSAVEKLAEIIKDLPAEQIAEFVHAKQEKPKQQIQTEKNDKPHILGLNRGQIWYSEDFADPLPDDFWNFSKDDDSTEQAQEIENK